MGSNQDNETSANFSIQNDLMQVTQSSCRATCQSIQSGTTVVINDSTVLGGITLTNECSANIACVMSQTLSSNVDNIMSSMVKQAQVASNNFFSFTFKHQSNKATINDHISNNITQIMTSTCQASATALQTDTTVLVNKSTITGGITLANRGNASANCTMNNTGKIVLYNKQQATVDQEQKIFNIFAIIALVILICIVLYAVVTIISHVLTSRRYHSGTMAQNNQSLLQQEKEENAEQLQDFQTQEQETRLENERESEREEPQPELMDGSRQEGRGEGREEGGGQNSEGAVEEYALASGLLNQESNAAVTSEVASEARQEGRESQESAESQAIEQQVLAEEAERGQSAQPRIVENEPEGLANMAEVEQAEERGEVPSALSGAERDNVTLNEITSAALE